MSVQITVAGLNDVIARLLEMQPKLKDEIRRVFEATAQQCLSVMDSLTPVDTGLLQSNNSATVTSEPILTLANDTPYARFVIFGTYKMAARDFMTPAMVFGRSFMLSELARMKLV